MNVLKLTRVYRVGLSDTVRRRLILLAADTFVSATGLEAGDHILMPEEAKTMLHMAGGEDGIYVTETIDVVLAQLTKEPKL